MSKNIVEQILINLQNKDFLSSNNNTITNDFEHLQQLTEKGFSSEVLSYIFIAVHNSDKSLDDKEFFVKSLLTSDELQKFWSSNNDDDELIVKILPNLNAAQRICFFRDLINNNLFDIELDPEMFIEKMSKDSEAQKDMGSIRAYSTIKQIIVDNKKLVSNHDLTETFLKGFIDIFYEQFPNTNSFFKDITDKHYAAPFFSLLIDCQPYLTNFINVYKEQIVDLYKNTFKDLSNRLKSNLKQAGFEWVSDDDIKEEPK